MLPWGRIDFHTHVMVELPDFAARHGDRRWPTFAVGDDGAGRLFRGGQLLRTLGLPGWQLSKRLEDMDAAGVDVQVLSPLPPLICDWAPSAAATDWCDHINAELSRIVQARPERFRALGIVPLSDPDAAVAVLKRAQEAGLSGVEIGTNVGDRELDHPDLREFFAAAEELGMVVFVHPLVDGLDNSWTPRISGPVAVFGLGMSTDTAIAGSRLVFGGVTRQCPQLRVCLAHGGGTFAWALPRMERAWELTGGSDVADVADLLQNVFVDSVVYSAANAAYLCDQLGPSQVMFGTDYPLPAQDDIHGSSLDALPPPAAALTGRANAAAVLGLSRT